MLCAEKYCNGCKQTLPVNDFYVRRNHIRADGEPVRDYRCKRCNAIESKAWRAKTGYKNKKKYHIHHKENWYNSRIKSLYGVTKERYDEQLQKQGGLCAICGGLNTNLRFSLFIDHDHTTGSFRGLLCRACNNGLGFFKDNPQLLRDAAKYLEGQRCQSPENF